MAQVYENEATLDDVLAFEGSRDNITPSVAGSDFKFTGAGISIIFDQSGQMIGGSGF